MKGSTQKPVSLEALAASSTSIRTVARWLSKEWGRGQGYSYQDTLSWCRDLANSESEVIICANWAGQPVGAALLVKCDLPSHPHFSPWLSSLFVVPKHRRHGIGGSLIKELCDVAEKRGHTKVYLHALDGPLIPFYRRLGWLSIERVDIAGREFVLMRKTL